MQSGGRPGQFPKSSDGQRNVPIRLGNMGDQIASELHGRYFESTYRKNSFWAANQALTTTSVGTTTAYFGMVVSNPINSPVCISLQKCTLMQSVIQSSNVEGYSIGYGWSPTVNVSHTAALTVKNSYIGPTITGFGLADQQATLPVTPTYGSFVTNTQSATTNSVTGVFDLEGSVVLGPGAFACWMTPTQAAVSGLWFSMSWEEVPL